LNLRKPQSVNKPATDPQRSRKILVADDDPAILHSLRMLLEDEGYDVETASGDKTEQAVMEHLPDLILLDIWMSGMDGRDICKHLKSQESTMNIIIIMISAHQDTEKIAKASGADDFVTKPFDIFKLLEKIEQYV
jgi:CheY-like chemotaxis protein